MQKYFLKLAKAGLPVPGRIPNLANYVRNPRRVSVDVGGGAVGCGKGWGSVVW